MGDNLAVWIRLRVGQINRVVVVRELYLEVHLVKLLHLSLLRWRGRSRRLLHQLFVIWCLQFIV